MAKHMHFFETLMFVKGLSCRAAPFNMTGASSHDPFSSVRAYNNLKLILLWRITQIEKETDLIGIHMGQQFLYNYSL